MDLNNVSFVMRLLLLKNKCSAAAQSLSGPLQIEILLPTLSLLRLVLDFTFLFVRSFMFNSTPLDRSAHPIEGSGDLSFLLLRALNSPHSPSTLPLLCLSGLAGDFPILTWPFSCTHRDLLYPARLSKTRPSSRPSQPWRPHFSSVLSSPESS